MKREVIDIIRLLRLISLSVLFGFGWLHAVAQEETLSENFQSFSFEAVRIPIWVTDRHGLPQGGLTRKDFNLLVDGRSVEIENLLLTHNAPVEVVYLIDLSGSMGLGGKLLGSVQTIDWLISQHTEADRWRIIVFSDGEIIEVANQSKPEEWERVKPRLRAYGKTALFDVLASSHLYFDPDSLNSRAVLVFTDGNDNHSDVDEPQLLKVLGVVRVPLFVVGICSGFLPGQEENQEKLGLQTLRNIATITGGSLFLAESADHLPIIGRTLKDKLRPQYMLTMTVERVKEEQRHQILVRLVRKRHYQLRYRQGYLGSVPQFRGGN